MECGKLFRVVSAVMVRWGGSKIDGDMKMRAVRDALLGVDLLPQQEGVKSWCGQQTVPRLAGLTLLGRLREVGYTALN